MSAQAGPSANVTLLASRVRQEEKAIVEAARRRGVAVVHQDPRTLIVAADTWRPETGTVLNREIGQVRAFYAATALEAVGAAVVNTAEATRISGDKWLTTLALLQHGVPTPRAVLAASPEAGLAALELLGYPAVVKPLVGSWGRLIARVGNPEAAVTVFEHRAALPSPQAHVLYLQQEIRGARDIRVIVVGGRPLGATQRSGTDWRANVARGAGSQQCPLTADLAKYAVAAADAVGAEIAGVDLLQDPSGELTVLEVNDRVEFAGFQRAHHDRVDVAEAIVDYLLARAIT